MRVQDAMDAVEKLRYLAKYGERDHGPAVRAAAKRAHDALCDLIRLTVEAEQLEFSTDESAP